MRFNVKTGDVLKEQVDLAVVFADEKAELPENCQNYLADDFSGNLQTLLLYTRKCRFAVPVLLVGLGESMKLLLIPFETQQPIAIKETIRSKQNGFCLPCVGETDADESVLPRRLSGVVLGSYRFRITRPI